MVGTTIEHELEEVAGKEKNPKQVAKKVDAHLRRRLGIAPQFAVVNRAHVLRG